MTEIIKAAAPANILEPNEDQLHGLMRSLADVTLASFAPPVQKPATAPATTLLAQPARPAFQAVQTSNVSAGPSWSRSHSPKRSSNSSANCLSNKNLNNNLNDPRVLQALAQLRTSRESAPRIVNSHQRPLAYSSSLGKAKVLFPRKPNG